MLDLYTKLLCESHCKTTLPFLKCHVFGNDFVLIDDSQYKYETSVDRVGKLCNRHFGIGADDVVFVRKENNKNYMKVINPDGSECEICGNALLLASKYFYDTSDNKSDLIKINTLAGEKTVRIHNRGEKVVANMGVPKFETKHINYPLNTESGLFYVTHINMGVPQTILFVEELDQISVNKLGSSIENHQSFPQKTNVMFVKVLDETNIALRCWERGMTGETYACGTGACASAVASVLNNKCKRNVNVKFQKGEASILWDTDNSVIVTGSVEYVYSGLIIV